MNTLHQFDEVFDTQRVFRKLLEAMSNPGRTVSVSDEKDKLFGNCPSILAAAVTLLDNEVSFNTSGNTELENDIMLVTLSPEVCTESADYIFVTDADTLADVFEKAKCGTLSDPHCSATIIILDNGKKCSDVCLCGPGINGEKEISCSETFCMALELRDAQNYEYPQGVDLIFVSDSGDITAVPRLVKRRESNGICCGIRR
ncbi:MAG: phosphonate C-P lyase system protein PhnH [Porcipelethomonas sp.]